MENIVLFRKTHPDAVIPLKGDPDAIGYDLTCINAVQKSKKRLLCNTHIQIEPPPNIYFEVVPRSSFSESGYIMTNSIGIIDSTYRGDIKIPITKIENTSLDIEFPFKKFQLIPRRIQPNLVFQEGILTETKRGAGGFGSTDLK
jgi:dUTP pyrophosphatase